VHVCRGVQLSVRGADSNLFDTTKSVADWMAGSGSLGTPVLAGLPHPLPAVKTTRAHCYFWAAYRLTWVQKGGLI
jgi:hypothetical protein